MASKSCGALAVLSLVALAGAGCSPTDDDGMGRDVPRPGDGIDVSGADADADADADPGADDVVRPEVPDSDWEACGVEDLPLEYAVSSDVLIVLDRSGSMAMTLNPLKTAVRTVVDASDDRMWFGLMPFPSTIAPNACRMVAPASQCAAPATPQVPPEPSAFPDIDGALGPIAICGSTPTTVTLQNVLAYLLSAPTGHTQYVLLVTDGVPNCNSSLDPFTCTCPGGDPTACTCPGGDPTSCTPVPEACLDDAAAYAVLDALLANGIKTYVLGMGMGLRAGDVDIMNAMAARGGTEHFYAAEDPGSILGTFEAIMGTIVLSCTFDLHPTGDVDPAQVNLYVGDEVVPQDPDHVDGWDYVEGDPDSVEFYGPICETILSGDVTSVRAGYGCPTIII